MSMRQLIVQVPAERERDVLELLQGEACQLKNVTRHSDGIVATCMAYIDRAESGPVLHELDKIGVGSAYGKVAMVPVMLVKPLPKIGDKLERHLAQLVSEENWYMRGRLSIEEMYSNVSEGCNASFDFVIIVIVAAWISAVGLATNSSVMIVASMLISPLMGPILAFCFGTNVQDVGLIKKGIMVEAIGIFATFMVGAVAGLVCSAWSAVPAKYSWPTQASKSC